MLRHLINCCIIIIIFLAQQHKTTGMIILFIDYAEAAKHTKNDKSNKHKTTLKNTKKNLYSRRSKCQ